MLLLILYITRIWYASMHAFLFFFFYLSCGVSWILVFFDFSFFSLKSTGDWIIARFPIKFYRFKIEIKIYFAVGVFVEFGLKFENTTISTSFSSRFFFCVQFYFVFSHFFFNDSDSGFFFSFPSSLLLAFYTHSRCIEFIWVLSSQFNSN